MAKCTAAYKEIDNRFSFLSQLTTIESDELTKKCNEFYHEDINAYELKTECFHLSQYLKNIAISGFKWPFLH